MKGIRKMKKTIMWVGIIAAMLVLGTCCAFAQDDSVKMKYDELKAKSAVALNLDEGKPEEGHGRWFNLVTSKFDQDTGEKKTITTAVKNDHVETELGQLKEKRAEAAKALVDMDKQIASMELLHSDMAKLLPVEVK